MHDRNLLRIAGFLLGGFVAVALVVGLMAALYPFAQEALGGGVAAGAFTPSS
jgi:hypothetical protein